MDSKEASEFAQASEAVRRLASGRFAHRGGFGLDIRSPEMGSTALRDALRYFGTREEPAETRKSMRRPTVLELCAGAGGSAIGLMGAGFQHVALYEQSGVRVKTLRKNWPSWKVVQADIGNVPDERFKHHAGVDLLAAGLPCGPGEHTEAKPDLFGQVLEIVGLVSPRSVLLQFDKGENHKGNERRMAAVLASLREKNYRSFEFNLNTAKFGLPHSREHGFIVAIHNDVPGVFRDPSALDQVERKVSSAFRFLFNRDKVPNAALARSHPQRIFNHWVDTWLEDHATKTLPTVFRGKRNAGDREKSWLASWLDSGFNPAEVRRELPKVGDAEVTDPKFKPFLTFEILAVAQGFPPRWDFVAERSGILDMIADALPPVMAKIVGLSLRSILEGSDADLNLAITTPVINESLIGVRGRNPVKLNWPTSEIQSKAFRYLLGEELANVESNHMRRGPIKEERDRLLVEWKARAADENGDWGPFPPRQFT